MPDPEPDRRATFRVGDVFGAEDPLAHFVVSVSMAWNDLRRSNARLLAGLAGDSTPAENLHDVSAVGRHVVEFAKLLRESRASGAVLQLLRALPEDIRKDLSYCYRVTRPGPTKFRVHLVAGRNLTSHYPGIGEKRLKRALANLADSEGELLLGPAYKDVVASYADEISGQLFCLKAGGASEADQRRHVTMLQRVAERMIRVAVGILAAYLEPRRDHVMLSPLEIPAAG